MIVILNYHQAQALVHFCTNVEELRHAMDVARGGDEIILKSGTTFNAADSAKSGKGAHFFGNFNAPPDQRIVMRSESPDDPATLSGSNLSHYHVLRLFGNNWTIRDIIVTHAQKGIVLDHANSVHIVGCQVHNIGLEAIHVRDGSKFTLIEDCHIHNTGKVAPAFGEGIYVGSDKNKWYTQWDPDVRRTTIRGCTIGPNIGAEAFDVKEGSYLTIIEHNIVHAEGISGQNYADAFIDLKGVKGVVRYNIFHRDNAHHLQKGVAIIKRPTPGTDSGPMSSYEHVIHDNTFYMNGMAHPIVHAHSGTHGIYAFNNSPNSPFADRSVDGIQDSCCPSWYTQPSSSAKVLEYDASDYANYADESVYSSMIKDETSETIGYAHDSFEYPDEIIEFDPDDHFDANDDGIMPESFDDYGEILSVNSPEYSLDTSSTTHKYGFLSIRSTVISLVCCLLIDFY